MAQGIARVNGVCTACAEPIIAGESMVKWAPSKPGQTKHEQCFDKPNIIEPQVAPLIQIQKEVEMIPEAKHDEVPIIHSVNTVPVRKGIDTSFAGKLAAAIDGHVPAAVQNAIDLAISAMKQEILEEIKAKEPPEWVTQRSPKPFVRAAHLRLGLRRHLRKRPM